MNVLYCSLKDRRDRDRVVVRFTWMSCLVVYYFFVAKFCVIYDENVLFCSLLNVCNKNDQFKVNGHNCASLSLSPIYFIENNGFMQNFLKLVLRYWQIPIKGYIQMNFRKWIHLKKKLSTCLLCNKIKSRKVLLRFNHRRYWLTMSSSEHDL